MTTAFDFKPTKKRIGFYIWMLSLIHFKAKMIS